MAKIRDASELAIKYHNALPARIRQYLNERGIPDALVDFHLLGWNGIRITIPIFSMAGEVVFFKLAKDPQDTLPMPKMMASPGSYVELYGWGNLLSNHRRVIICEGEFDRLVLEAHGFPAVTSTGGAGTFRPEWVKAFQGIPEVFVCFDRDEPGQAGALRVARMIPGARMVTLPEEVGEGGDITDYFVRLGRTAEDFEKLLETAVLPEPEPTPIAPPPRPTDGALSVWRERADQVKARVPIEKLVGQYIKLHKATATYAGLCPFHDDHNPSMTLYPATGTFHCFGCGNRGDVIKFLMEIERISFVKALEALERFEPKDEQPQTGN